jgi:hypothetical protein
MKNGLPADSRAMVSARLGRRVPGSQQGQRQLAPLRRRQRLDGQLAPLDALARLVRFQEGVQERTVGRVLAPVTTEKQQGRGVGRSEQVPQERGAVEVAPLQVVDEQHQGTTVGQAPQEFAQGGEAAPPDLMRIGNRAVAPGDAGYRLQAARDREDPGQRPDAAGQQRLYLQQGQGLQVAAEGVHQAVQRLVGHGLLLIATSRQHHRLAAQRQAVEEPLDQGCLAHTRVAVDVERDGPSLPACAERSSQGLEVSLATDQGNFRGRSDPVCRGQGALHRMRTEPAKHVVPGWPLPGVAAQQLSAERAEVVRDSLYEARGVRRVEVLLLPQDFERCAAEGRPAGERLVEH